MDRPAYNTAEALSAARKQFFALRNGLIADTLRKGGLEQKYIFGLQLPQIKEIAQLVGNGKEEDGGILARELWKDRECRESRLLAMYLMPAAAMTAEEAGEWTRDIRSREEADILAFRIIRHMPEAAEIAETLSLSDDALMRYAATAIKRFL